MKPINKYIFIIVFSCFGFSQDKDLGTWNVFNVQYKANKNWSYFVEGQIRSLSFYNNFHYYEIKGGVNYHLDENISFTTGFGSYNTYSEGGNFKKPFNNEELRSWGQVNFKNNYSFLIAEHRYRAEQRWTSNGFRNRFRYRLLFNVPTKIAQKKLNLITWNELFFTNNQPYFERNRFFVGTGFQVDKNLAMQLGYIYQFDYKLTDETGRNFMNVIFQYTIDKSKKDTKNFEPINND